MVIEGFFAGPKAIRADPCIYSSEPALDCTIFKTVLFNLSLSLFENWQQRSQGHFMAGGLVNPDNCVLKYGHYHIKITDKNATNILCMALLFLPENNSVVFRLSG